MREGKRLEMKGMSGKGQIKQDEKGKRLEIKRKREECYKVMGGKERN